MIGIYKITNPKGKVYIGKSINIKKRFLQYKNLHCKLQVILYNSFLKYGFEKHIFEVLCECEKEELDLKEKYYQELYTCVGVNGLNCFINGDEKEKRFYSKESKKSFIGKRKGMKIKCSEELRIKKSNNLKNNSLIYKRYGENNYFFGKKHSEETKRIISIKNSGPNNVFYGKKRPLQSEKMSKENHPNWGKKLKWLSEMNKKRTELNNIKTYIMLDVNSFVYYYGLNDYCKIHNMNICTLRYKLRTNKLPHLLKV